MNKETQSTAQEIDLLQEIQLGLGSAMAVFNECEIVVPDNHPDPTAINDCINLTRDAYESINKLIAAHQFKQSPSDAQKGESGGRKELLLKTVLGILNGKILNDTEKVKTSASLIKDELDHPEERDRGITITKV
jgi:hypothetical protein